MNLSTMLVALILTMKILLEVLDTKYEFVHNVGSLDFNHENSSRSILEDIPFIRLTTLCIPNCGSTSKIK